jgi:uncharacterized protein (DUF58 family)
LTVLRPAISRGVSLIHEVRLWTAAPFGMLMHSRRLTLHVKISVHPAPGPIAALPSRSADPGAGRADRVGDEPHELREWRHGDSLRQVHWRATARHDRLTVVIPERTVRSRMAMVIHGPGDIEALLSTAAWTAVEATRSAGDILLCAAGNPTYVGDDPAAVLDWFAALGPIGVTGPDTLNVARSWLGNAGTLVVASTSPTSASRFGPGLLVLTSDGRVATT